VLRQLFADKSVTRAPIERDRLVLDFSGAEIEPSEPAATAFILRVLQHPAADTGSARRGIDIHPAQFHGIRRCPLKAEHANQAAAQGRHPKPAAMLGIVGLDPINLIGQRALDIGFESVAQIRRAEQPVDFNDQLADARTIGIPERADLKLHAAHGLSHPT
jgi:hypothetical protein